MIVQIKHTDTEADARAFTGVHMWMFKGGTAAAPVPDDGYIVGTPSVYNAIGGTPVLSNAMEGTPAIKPN